MLNRPARKFAARTLPINVSILGEKIKPNILDFSSLYAVRQSLWCVVHIPVASIILVKGFLPTTRLDVR